MTVSDDQTSARVLQRVGQQHLTAEAFPLRATSYQMTKMLTPMVTAITTNASVEMLCGAVLRPVR